jgi:hypothetical protein
MDPTAGEITFLFQGATMGVFFTVVMVIIVAAASRRM